MEKLHPRTALSLMKNLKPLTSAPPRPVITWDKHARIVRNKEIWDQAESIVHRLPQHYQQRYWRNTVLADASPVHYEKPQNRLMWDERRLVEVELEDYPIRPQHVPEADQGLWAGEGVIKGYYESKPYTKKKILPRLWIPQFWWPEYYETVLHSEVLNAYFQFTVTARSQQLIDEAYGLDLYLLTTPEIDVNSKLGMKLKRRILIALAEEDYYHDDKAKRAYITAKYEPHRLPLEEAEWVGLDLNDACRKQQDIEDNKRPLPEKYLYMQELIQRLASGEEPIENPEDEDKPRYQKSLFAEKSAIGRMMKPMEESLQRWRR